MADTIVGFDPTQPVGSRFLSVAVQEEIGALAPQFFLPGAITQSMLAPGAVTQSALATGCVTAAALATDCVTAAALASNSVTAAAIAPSAVTITNLAPGVPSVTDNAGNPLSIAFVICTSAQYSVIAGGTPSDSALYFVTD